MVTAQCPQSRLGGDTGGESVIDEDDVMPGESGDGATGPVLLDSAGDDLALPGDQHVEVGIGQSELTDQGGLHRCIETLGDGGDAEFLTTGSADLAGHEHLERYAQGDGDLVGDRNASPGQSEKQRLGEAYFNQTSGELAPGVAPIQKPPIPKTPIHRTHGAPPSSEGGALNLRRSLLSHGFAAYG